MYFGHRDLDEGTLIIFLLLNAIPFPSLFKRDNYFGSFCSVGKAVFILDTFCVTDYFETPKVRTLNNLCHPNPSLNKCMKTLKRHANGKPQEDQRSSYVI